jgi:hypothetical protein
MEFRGYVETLMTRSKQLEAKINYLMAYQGDGHANEMHEN